MNTILRSMYLNWVNNYLSVEVFAEHNNITVNDAHILIGMGKRYHEEYVQLNKGDNK